jgi:hypothetical protein
LILTKVNALSNANVEALEGKLSERIEPTGFAGTAW